jgi:hypothetical protein
VQSRYAISSEKSEESKERASVNRVLALVCQNIKATDDYARLSVTIGPKDQHDVEKVSAKLVSVIGDQQTGGERFHKQQKLLNDILDL